MSYQATVLSIIIAAPGDTKSATRVIFKAIRNWNAKNAKRYGVILQPEKFDVSSITDKKGAAQKSEIEMLLNDCDMLAGAFWTRTGKTSDVKKICFPDILDEHINSGKPLLLFFSTHPIIDDSANAMQYKKFNEFKEKCRAKNVFETYDDIDELKDKVKASLEQFFSEERFLVAEDSEIETEPEIEIEAEANIGTEPDIKQEPEVMAQAPVAMMQPPKIKDKPKEEVKIPTLSENAATLLREAVKDAKTLIIRRRKISDTVIMANEKNFVENNDMVDIIRWEAAIRELEYKGLIEDINHGGEYYKLTGEGKRVAKLI